MNNMASDSLFKVKIGCAGWVLSSNSKATFPSAGSHLERYAKVFSAVEINSSFYRSHRPATYARWRNSVPDDFRFSVKMPRTISHVYRLSETKDLLSQFLNEVGQLQEKCACFLLQLPPSFVFDGTIADSFFKCLRQQTGVATVCEPRHPTWFSSEASDMLQRYDIGRVFADPMPIANVKVTVIDRATYIRLHGSPVLYRSAYADTFLSSIAERMTQVIEEVDSVWCIFDNTAGKAAISNALSLKKILQSHVESRRL